MGGGSRKLVGLHVLDRFQRGFEGLAVGGSGAAPSDHAFKLIAPVSELMAKLAQVAIEQGVDRVLGVAMQVNEGAEVLRFQLRSISCPSELPLLSMKCICISFNLEKVIIQLSNRFVSY